MKSALIGRFIESLKPNGVLFIGATEALLGRRNFPLNRWDTVSYLDRVRMMYDPVLFVIGEQRWSRVQSFFNEALQWIGLTDQPLRLSRNEFGVVVGMVHFMLPLAILPVYANLRGINASYVTAARRPAGPRRPGRGRRSRSWYECRAGWRRWAGD